MPHPCPAGARRGGVARRERGATLVEMLVVMAIISILAVTALPFAETAVQRRKEIALQETLRTVRTAIDAFHQDWAAGRMGAEAEDGAASDAGYPTSLGVLASGVEIVVDGGEPELRKYLRRPPENPFAEGEDAASQWRLIGYAQDPDAARWDGKDVYDLRAVTEREALDGTRIADW